MFPKVRKTDLDLKELGEQMKQRKDALARGSPFGTRKRRLAR